jgi:hypothetical protein
MASLRQPLPYPPELLQFVETIGNEYKRMGVIIEDSDIGTEAIPLANRTVRFLTHIVNNLMGTPLTASDLVMLDRMIALGGILPGNAQSLALAQRFTKHYFDLAYDQIYAPEGEDGIPRLDPFMVRYPLKVLLPKLEEHDLREHPDMKYKPEIFDFMFDVDESINRAILFIVKFFAHAIEAHETENLLPGRYI